MNFNLTETVSFVIGKTLSCTYHSIRHPFSFGPKNIVQIFKDARSGFNSGIKNYNTIVVNMQKIKVEIQNERETNLSEG